MIPVITLIQAELCKLVGNGSITIIILRKQWSHEDWLVQRQRSLVLSRQGRYYANRPQEINGTRYYLNASGAMETGWKQLNGNWYYFQTNGSLLRNGTSPDGYKLNADGIWTTVTTEETTQEQTVANSQGHIFETTEVERTQQTESSSVTSEEKNQSTEPKTQTSEEQN